MLREARGHSWPSFHSPSFSKYLRSNFSVGYHFSQREKKQQNPEEKLCLALGRDKKACVAAKT